MVVSRMPEANDPTTTPERPLRAADEVDLAFDLAPREIISRLVGLR